MSHAHVFKPPFSDALTYLNHAQVAKLKVLAESGQVQSLDDVDLRMRALSDARGFLEIKLTFHAGEMKDEEVLEDNLDLLMNALADCQVRGVRGQRAVLVNQTAAKNGSDAILSVWIGRNVWFNKHRMTAGFPETDEQTDSVLEDLESRLFDEFDSFIDVQVAEQGVTKDDVQNLINDLLFKANAANVLMNSMNQKPETVLSSLIDDVREWLENSEDILRD